MGPKITSKEFPSSQIIASAVSCYDTAVKRRRCCHLFCRVNSPLYMRRKTCCLSPWWTRLLIDTLKARVLTLPDFSSESFPFPFLPFAFPHFPSNYYFCLAPLYYFIFLFAYSSLLFSFPFLSFLFFFFFSIAFLSTFAWCIISLQRVALSPASPEVPTRGNIPKLLSPPA